MSICPITKESCTNWECGTYAGCEKWAIRHKEEPMKTLLDKDFSYVPSHSTDISKRFRQVDLERDIGILQEVAEYLEDCSDVVDGADGPRPNKAMNLLRDVENLIAKLKGNV